MPMSTTDITLLPHILSITGQAARLASPDYLTLTQLLEASPCP